MSKLQAINITDNGLAYGPYQVVGKNHNRRSLTWLFLPGYPFFLQRQIITNRFPMAIS